MTKRFGLSALLGASALVLTSAAAMAQPSPSGASPDYSASNSAPGAPGGGAPGGAATAGAVDTSTTTTTTVTDAGGGGEFGSSESVAGASETMANTGGAPLVVSMLGALVAGSAFFLRRKLD